MINELTQDDGGGFGRREDSNRGFGGREESNRGFGSRDNSNSGFGSGGDSNRGGFGSGNNSGQSDSSTIRVDSSKIGRVIGKKTLAHLPISMTINTILILMVLFVTII